MINYGQGPESDQLEVIVFGPGVGEAIALHVGAGKWLLIDSCEERKGHGSVTLHYLDSIGVSPADVLAIVATHWHDDHVRAISDLAKKYPSADFYISGVLREDESLAFLATYGGKAAPGQTGGTRELANILGSRLVKVANSQTYLLDEEIGGRHVKVVALSPLPAAFRKAAAHMGKYLVGPDQPINKAPPEPSPNAAAIVIHANIGGESILLGADLEDNGTWGWSAMVQDSWAISRGRASAYKVAHHGSKSGDSECIWQLLLCEAPVSCVTPFVVGRHSLPTNEDKKRIKDLSGRSFIASAASRKPAIDSELLKRLNDICLDVRRVETGLGAIRLRKKPEDLDWATELFGAAQQI